MEQTVPPSQLNTEYIIKKDLKFKKNTKISVKNFFGGIIFQEPTDKNLR